MSACTPMYMFGDDPSARDLLKEAARARADSTTATTTAGRTESRPACRRTARSGTRTRTAIQTPITKRMTGMCWSRSSYAAINDILARAASGTAASVLATNAEGEGNLVQAYFRPSQVEGTSEVRWVGYLQSLWVDPCGNLREDSNQNKRLDMNEDADNDGSLDYGEDINGNSRLDTEDDLIVHYYSDPLTADTVIHRYTKHWIYDHPLDCEEADATPSDYEYETLALEAIKPIWEVGKVLAERDPSTRRIFTYVDPDLERDVDDGGNRESV
jgi:hypothetical protein